jgi:hypothetical protein
MTKICLRPKLFITGQIILITHVGKLDFKSSPPVLLRNTIDFPANTLKDNSNYGNNKLHNQLQTLIVNHERLGKLLKLLFQVSAPKNYASLVFLPGKSIHRHDKLSSPVLTTMAICQSQANT